VTPAKKIGCSTATGVTAPVLPALGVAAALHDDADVATTCGDCGEAMSLEVRDGAPLPQDCAIHFAVPAAHWWDDIVYT